MSTPIPNDASRWHGHGVLNANGARWRLRALVAMGHSPQAIADAMGVSLNSVKPLITGQRRGVTPELRERAVEIFEAWWNLTPPQETREQRITATKMRQRAERENWPTGMGLAEPDPDYTPRRVPEQPAARVSQARTTEIIRAGMDHPDYRPRTGWQPATGRGVAQYVQRDAERELEAG
jgi:plasmid maintenance system antidote protein VapI